MKKKLLCLLLIFTMTFTAFAATASVSFGASSPKYWLKVNAQANVVTVYQKIDGQWEPVRAMLCSTGTGKKGSENATPTGTYYIKGRWDWGAMVGGVYARYVVQFYGDYLFHSVPYEKVYDKASQPTKEYNKLGKDASHGCVRLSITDAKWVYENCPQGTKVTIYNSSNPGPLGKPSGIKVSTARKTYWDPTDPDADNPYYCLPKPVITVSSTKKLTVQYGSSYKLKSGVTAKDPNTFADLTSKVKIYSVKWYNAAKGTYTKSSFSTKKLGTYKITYRVYDKYCGASTKTIKINVVDNLKAPTISGAVDRVVPVGTINAVEGVTAKQSVCDRTNAIKVYIQTPDMPIYKYYTYKQAQTYIFSKTGNYTVKYVVENKYKPFKSTTKIVTVTCE